MFGKIVGIENDNLKMVNLSKKAEISLINIHVVLLSGTNKCVGIINNINEEYIFIKLIGEIINNKFVAGVTKYPSLASSCRIITKQELTLILGSQDIKDKNTLLLGSSDVYNDFKIAVDKNNFFSTHFAFLGNTGSGKSCAIARLIQNVFYNNDMDFPINSHFVIFDAFGDYKSAFESIDSLQKVRFKNITCDYTTNIEKDDNIKIPPYFLDVDDLAILLDINTPDLIPTLENTLRIAYIFTSNDSSISKYQNSIIASSLLDILASGKTATQIRDQIIAVLTKFNTPELNLDSTISQPGYDRTLKQCLLIDNQGKINAMDLVVDFLDTFVLKDLDNIDITPGFVYTLQDLYNALEFSLINEGILTSKDQSYDKLNSLKIRLRAIINSDLKNIFEVDKVISKAEYVESFFKTAGNNAQVVCVNFGDLSERMIKTFTKILSKLFFNYTTTLQNRGSFPIHIIIEEAHRYVQNDTDLNVLGYNIFERITKEGRKYGIILGLVTQRPSELPKTVLSQCGNFAIFRMQHPDDIEIVNKVSTNVNDTVKEQLKLLHPGTALCFGNSFNTPLIVKFDLPNPMPASTNIKVTNIWY